MADEEPRVVWEDIEALIERRYGVTIHPFKRDFPTRLYRELQQAYAQKDLAKFDVLLLLMDLAVESSVQVTQ